MARDFLTPIRMPRAATFPGSPAQGDAVVLTTDGLLYVYDGTAWVPAGVSSRKVGGVLSNANASAYASASNIAGSGGATDFVVMALVVFTEPRDNGAIEPIASVFDASAGWLLSHKYGQLTASVRGSASWVEAFATTTYFSANARLGELIPVAMRVFDDAGTMRIELWEGPARVATGSSAADAPVVNTTDPLRVMTGTYFGSTAPLNGIVAGLGYYAGTVTNAQMRALLGQAQATGEVPLDVVTWGLCYQGQAVKTAPTTWVPTLGSGDLTKSGSPEGVENYFPPGASANNVIIGGGGAAAEAGRATLDFGTRTQIASVFVANTTVTSSSRIVAAVAAVATSDHTRDETIAEPIDIRVGDIQDGVGFTIYGICRNGTASSEFFVDWIKVD